MKKEVFLTSENDALAFSFCSCQCWKSRAYKKSPEKSFLIKVVFSQEKKLQKIVHSRRGTAWKWLLHDYRYTYLRDIHTTMSILFSATNLTIFSTRRYQINYKDVDIHSPKFQTGDASNILSEVEVFLSEKIPCGYFSWEKTEQRNGSSSKKKHTKRKKLFFSCIFTSIYK